jgi:hypothetical protein
VKIIKKIIGLLIVFIFVAYTIHIVIVMIEGKDDPVTQNFAGAAISWVVLLFMTLLWPLYKLFFYDKDNNQDLETEWSKVRKMALKVGKNNKKTKK